jgi:hypothetical protein
LSVVGPDATAGVVTWGRGAVPRIAARHPYKHRAAGAPIVTESEDQPFGERMARTRDPGGNLVYLGSAN